MGVRATVMPWVLCLLWGVNAQAQSATLAPPLMHDAPAQAAVPAAIPYKDDTPLEKSLGRLGWVLLGLGAVAAIVVQGRKRCNGARPAARGRRLEVVETLRLSPRNTLLLVELDRRALLLAVNGNELKVLLPPDKATTAQPPVLAVDEVLP